ncbi:coronin-A-like [Schistocerca gregaria]|uniref:coronin-A-like n=1 Tax=Schistocerca gregaria TaxID=7010 RepID=UPI00211DBB85|nr:coronin-A-like [Schistocerca gregaria]
MNSAQPSKYRHIYGTTKSKSGYDCVKPRSARDANLIKVNSTMVAVQWDTPGYGALLVLPARDQPTSEPSKKEQRLPSNPPLLEPHTSFIQDFDFSPFEDSLLATSDGNCIRLWQIPCEGIQKTVREPNVEIKNSDGKILGIQFHQTSKNLMLSTHHNHDIKIFDIDHDSASILCNSGHQDIVQRTSWDWYGALLATSCRDKNLRIIDPRNNQITHCVLAHESIKGFTLTWLGQRDQIATVGFSKDGRRQLSAWDVRSFSKPLASLNIGAGSGMVTPCHDPTTDVIFLLGKGDTYISYYVIEDTSPFLSYLSEFKTSESQSDVAPFPPQNS